MEDFTYRPPQPTSYTGIAHTGGPSSTSAAQNPIKLEGWDAVVSHLGGGKPPQADTPWPQMLPEYCQQLAPIAELKAHVCSDDRYKQLITDNGKLFIGDFHSIPEGMITLHSMLKELPVKKVFVESQDDTSPLKSQACMDWLKDHPHATPAETFEAMAERFLKPTARAPQFLSAMDRFNPNITSNAKADVYRRWIEAECAVARHVIDNNIPVEIMFQTVDPDPKNFYNRSMNDHAWQSFMDTTTGTSVFLVGEKHITDTDPNDPNLYKLLETSNGIFARTPISELRFQQEESVRLTRMFAPGGSDFFKSGSTPQGPWRLETSIPGTSAQGGGNAAELKHEVAFKLYSAPAAASTGVHPQTPVGFSHQPVHPTHAVVTPANTTGQSNPGGAAVARKPLTQAEVLRRFRAGLPLDDLQ